MNAQTNNPDLYAFVVTGSEHNPFFRKVGAAWKNAKGGFGVRLDALPLDGQIVLLPPQERETDSSASA